MYFVENKYNYYHLSQLATKNVGNSPFPKMENIHCQTSPKAADAGFDSRLEFENKIV